MSLRAVTLARRGLSAIADRPPRGQSPLHAWLVSLTRRRDRAVPWSVFLLSSFQAASPAPEGAVSESWAISARARRRRGLGSLG